MKLIPPLKGPDGYIKIRSRADRSTVPRGDFSSLWMISIVEIGAPVIEPQGKRARRFGSGRFQLVSDFQWSVITNSGYSLGEMDSLQSRNPVIAEEVDDHHVFCSIFGSASSKQPEDPLG